MLVWHSSFAALTGYSSSARAFVLGLDAQGVPVRPLYLYGADHDEALFTGKLHPRIEELEQQPLLLNAPQVVYAPGDRFSKNSGAYRIGFSMLEVSRIPPSWVVQANQMDEVWTPTLWGAEVFLASGVRQPIHVVPLGVDTAIFKPAPPRTKLTNHTIFLSVFDWGKRKGWDVLLRAYRMAFRPTDAVLLLLKIDCRVAAHPIQEIVALLPAPSPPVALIYNQPLTLAQLVELYQSADCFVLPTRGEGWGMPILEAMACGVPAITTDWSGQTAFLDAANGYPLPVRHLTPTGLDHPYYRNAEWAEPDGGALVDLLRRVVAEPAERQAKGRRAVLAAQQWSWERSVQVVQQRLASSGSYG